MAETLTQLMFKDADGSTENCGIVASSTEIDGRKVWLTYQRMDGEPEGLWWIIIRCEKLRKTVKMGYTEERRQACWHTFARMTPDDVERELHTPDTPSA